MKKMLFYSPFWLEIATILNLDSFGNGPFFIDFWWICFIYDEVKSSGVKVYDPKLFSAKSRKGFSEKMSNLLGVE